jgi:hypothetical protein
MTFRCETHKLNPSLRLLTAIHQRAAIQKEHLIRPPLSHRALGVGGACRPALSAPPRRCRSRPRRSPPAGTARRPPASRPTPPRRRRPDRPGRAGASIPGRKVLGGPAAVSLGAPRRRRSPSRRSHVRVTAGQRARPRAGAGPARARLTLHLKAVVTGLPARVRARSGPTGPARPELGRGEAGAGRAGIADRRRP